MLSSPIIFILLLLFTKTFSQTQCATSRQFLSNSGINELEDLEIGQTDLEIDGVRRQMITTGLTLNKKSQIGLCKHLLNQLQSLYEMLYSNQTSPLWNSLNFEGKNVFPYFLRQMKILSGSQYINDIGFVMLHQNNFDERSTKMDFEFTIPSHKTNQFLTARNRIESAAVNIQVFLRGLTMKNDEVGVVSLYSEKYISTIGDKILVKYDVSVSESISSLSITILYYTYQVEPRQVLDNQLRDFLLEIEGKEQINAFMGINEMRSFQSTRRFLTENKIPISEVQTFLKSFSVNGLTLSKNFILKVVFKDQFEEECITNEICLSRNGVIYENQQGQLQCFTCKDQNKFYSTQKNVCECFKGYIDVEGTCLTEQQRCGRGNILVDGLCYTPLGGGQNNTENGQINVTATLSCKLNEEFDFEIEKCVCENGFIKSQECGDLSCIQLCFAHEYYDCLSKSCISAIFCEQPQFFDEDQGQCVCEEGLVKHSDSCCSENAEYVLQEGQCICKEGFFGDGSFCRKIG